MDQEQFKILLGEWAGLGEMLVGDHAGKIIEHMKIEVTDVENCYSYIRKSSIDFGARVTLHNEMGYIKPTSTNLLLSRGSFIIMEWDETLSAYKQNQGSADSRNMIRKIIFNESSKMTWDNVMEVDHGARGGWVKHTANTDFLRVA